MSLIGYIGVDCRVTKNLLPSYLHAQMAKKALAEGRSPPQELEVGPRSRPYFLVLINGHSY